MDAIARALSITGHPVVALPLAVVLAQAPRAGTTAAPQATALLAAVLFGGVVLAWSCWQVRRGRWTHVDASRPRERSGLNRFLLVTLGLGALLAWRFASAGVAPAIGLAWLVIVLAMLSGRWCKLSLHVAFASYAALLLWRLGPAATFAGLLFAAGVAWSRLRLGRHVPRDLVAGALAGAGAGLLFWLVPAWRDGY